MCYAPYNMPVSTIATVDVPSTEPRAELLGVRLRASDVERLRVLAADAGVGVSTFARLVLEKYLATHARRRRRKKAASPGERKPRTRRAARGAPT